MEKWYSSNGEYYDYTALEDAARAVFDDPEIAVGDVRSVWEGVGIANKTGHYFPMCEVGLMMDHACDEHGEYAEGWLSDITPEQEMDLHDRIVAAINAWADDHTLHPTFGTVKAVREIKLRLTSNDGDFEITS